MTCGGKISSSNSSDEEASFCEAPSSKGGMSLQLQLQEYFCWETRRFACAANAVLGGQGGRSTWLLWQTPSRFKLGPRNPRAKHLLNVRVMREIRTLALALDQIAAGHRPAAADTIAQRLKALELSMTDQSWGRAQYMELLDPEGATLVALPMLLHHRMKNVSSASWTPSSPFTFYPKAGLLQAALTAFAAE